MSTTTKRTVTWPKAFGGYPCTLTIMQGPRGFTAVTLEGGGMNVDDDGWRIAEVPLDVLRDIVAWADALPKPAT